jgi:benzoyl-CoA reductase/2-hydroxyglutaryl-CoA dehydratase subunit BcrC/BadD/HgdB
VILPPPDDEPEALEAWAKARERIEARWREQTRPRCVECGAPLTMDNWGDADLGLWCDGCYAAAHQGRTREQVERNARVLVMTAWLALLAGIGLFVAFALGAGR